YSRIVPEWRRPRRRTRRFRFHLTRHESGRLQLGSDDTLGGRQRAGRVRQGKYRNHRRHLVLPHLPQVTARRLPAPPALAAIFVAPPAAAAVARDGWDEREVTRMRASCPQAVDLLEKGEALAIAGKLEEADAAFREGRAECSWSPLLRRRDCQALTALGRREE